MNRHSNYVCQKVCKICLFFHISDQAGKWKVEPSGIIDIDSGKGTALALKTGNARISYLFGVDLQVIF